MLHRRAVETPVIHEAELCHIVHNGPGRASVRIGELHLKQRRVPGQDRDPDVVALRRRSRVFQPPQSGLDNLFQTCQLRFERMPAGSGEVVGLAAVFRRDGADPTLLFETGDGAVKRAGAGTHAGKAFDVLHHGVAVLIAAGEVGEDEKGRVAHTLLRDTQYRET